MADGYDLARLAGLKAAKKLGTIDPTAHHEEMLRRIVMLVVRHYQRGETEIIEAFLSALSLGMPESIQARINQLRADAELPHREAIIRLNQWAKDVSAWHGKKWQARVMAGLNIDVTPLTRAETIEPALEKAMTDGARLIRDVSDDAAERVRAATLEAFETGEGAAALRKKLREEMGYPARRAKLIARDQLGKLTGNLDRLRHTEAGLNSYEWVTAGDERVRPKHEERDGEVFKWSKPPEDGHPGEPIQCFPGSTVLDLTQGGHRFWRRFYSGPLVSVLTHQGRHLQATPNHPVLTGRGWIPISDVQKGDDLVHCRLNYGPGGPHHADQSKARIGDLFESLARSQNPASARLSDFDFHGDVTHHEVDVVDADSLLRDDWDAKCVERLNQLLFPWADARWGDAGFDVVRLVGALKDRRFGSMVSQPLMGVLDEVASLLRAQSPHAQQVGGGAVANGNTVFMQDSLHRLSADAVLLRQFEHALSGNIVSADGLLRQICAAIVSKKAERRRAKVASDEVLAECIGAMTDGGGGRLLSGAFVYKLDSVVDLSVRNFSDHVYNLQTDSGWYTASGFVVHNCRCRARAVIPGMGRKGKTPI
jgi:SPP1 gp7 family putative phage head morphogenesis protein